MLSLNSLASSSTNVPSTIATKYVILNNLSCYDLKLKELSNKTTLVLSNTRELDRVPNTK